MNQRISLIEIRDRLRDQLDPELGIARVGCSLDHDYLAAVGESTSWPGVWVGGQRGTPIAPNPGFTGRFVQDVRVEIAVRVIVARYAAGEVDQEARLNRIVDAVVDKTLGYKPAGAVKPLHWVSSQDGPPEQSVMTADLIFQTQISHQYAPT